MAFPPVAAGPAGAALQAAGGDLGKVPVRAQLGLVYNSMNVKKCWSG